jgi:hypothetical protein
VLGRTRLGHLDDPLTHLEVPKSLARVVSEKRDAGFRRMLRSLLKPRMVLTRMHSPS